MSKPNNIHGIAICALIVVAGMSIDGAMRHPIGSTIERIMQPIIGFAMWAFFIGKIWKRPQRWSLGIGILLVVSLSCHIWLWRKAMATPSLRSMGGGHPLRDFTLDELPWVVAAISCFLLWMNQRRRGITGDG